MSSETVLFKLKRSLLEYCVAHQLDQLVEEFAEKQRTKFSSLNISLIRFELFNLYILIKKRHFDRFDSIIIFLNEFDTKFPNIIPENLFYRVQNSLKALVSI